jgi:hypothetical protein
MKMRAMKRRYYAQRWPVRQGNGTFLFWASRSRVLNHRGKFRAVLNRIAARYSGEARKVEFAE